ncbi:tRNA (adenosine(37)-N6)-threonylcarbamoyltransferase complex dimerization subunit type 1 TsaB [Secundilactobacillus malefermentans]|uniref:tRNA (adenosine(37)-N6)-threonylcarbamoyltransferase complex dimerization subunit type 1 TsaB n=1 Tax=Secundilactobacillus malefermentans TaxID=176292 RepID=UPI00165047AC|nr:tRNA (adenosine(37)-N6)-threonylcarbamoyltransferase complex dimerization subunit type 1 TsaB [Secundilactobacillus malefermentans]
MKVLALDTSNRPLSVALLEDQTVLGTVTMTVHQKHAEYLLPVIEDLMAKSDLVPADLNRVVVAQGPGSYTGIRIGVTTAKVLADTLKIGLVGVSSLQALALNCQRDGQLVWPIFDARNNNIFTGLYRMKGGVPESVLADQHVDFDDFYRQVDALAETVYVIGDGTHFADKFNDNYLLANSVDNLPQAARLGILGEKLQLVTDVNDFVPNYLRLTQAEADWKKQHPEEDAGSYVEKI